MKISVIGTGYLGAVHAAGMAALGHDVLGVDADQAKITALAEGVAPFYEPGFPELLTAMLATGRLRFGTSVAEAARFADVHFVCVGTPQQHGGRAADLSHVENVVGQLAACADRPALVVGKSTVPVGTAQALQDRIDAAGAPLTVAWNPEFLREGFAVQDTLAPDRLVLGVTRPADEITLRDVYAGVLDVGTPCVVTDLPTAELVKVAANAFLATKISFINAMAEICEATGGDVVTLADSIGFDARIGRRFLNAGVGFGGGCLGKDIRAFQARADELGLGGSLAFLREVDDINSRRRVRVVDMAAELLGPDLTGARITVLGAAFKPDSDDVRDSPSLHVADALYRRGAVVTVHDPAALDNARRARPELQYAEDVEKALTGAELVVHLTEWTAYRELDPARVATLVDRPRLIDARNALAVDAWAAAGWTVRCLGRTAPLPISVLDAGTTIDDNLEEAEFVA